MNLQVSPKEKAFSDAPSRCNIFGPLFETPEAINPRLSACASHLKSLGWLYWPSLGHFQVGSYRYRSIIEGLCTYYRNLIEAPYTLNSHL